MLKGYIARPYKICESKVLVVLLVVHCNVCNPHLPFPTVLQIFGRSVNTKKEKTTGRKAGVSDNSGKLPGSFLPGDEADIQLKWQEKVFGPQEIIAISGSHQQHQHRPGAPKRNLMSKLEVNYLRLLSLFIQNVGIFF